MGTDSIDFKLERKLLSKDLEGKEMAKQLWGSSQEVGSVCHSLLRCSSHKQATSQPSWVFWIDLYTQELNQTWQGPQGTLEATQKGNECHLAWCRQN